MIARRVLLMAAVVTFMPARLWAQPAVLKAGDVLRGRFVLERHLKGFATPLRSAGSFVLAAGQGLIWRVDKPFATTTVVTPAGLVQLAPDGHELTRLSSTRAPFLARLFDLLNAVLGGDTTELDQLFSVTREGTPDRRQLLLVPRRPEELSASRIQSIAVTLGRFAEEVDIRRTDDDFDHLSFLDQVVTKSPVTPEEAKLFAAAPS